jgi:hypothetical protein
MAETITLIVLTESMENELFVGIISLYFYLDVTGT